MANQSNGMTIPLGADKLGGVSCPKSAVCREVDVEEFMLAGEVVEAIRDLVDHRGDRVFEQLSSGQLSPSTQNK